MWTPCSLPRSKPTSLCRLQAGETRNDGGTARMGGWAVFCPVEPRVRGGGVGCRQGPLGNGCPDQPDVPAWVTVPRTLTAIYEVFSLTFEAHKIALSATGTGIRTPRMVSAVSEGESNRWEYQPHELQRALKERWEPWRHAQPGPEQPRAAGRLGFLRPGPLPRQGGKDSNTS